MAFPMSVLTPITKHLEKTLASSLLGSDPLDRSLLAFLAIVLTLLLISWVAGHMVKHRLRNDPPGPMPLPFFGNLFCFGTRPHVSLANLRQRYGPVIKLRIGWRSFVVVNSIEVMREALIRCTHDFDGRGDSFIGNMVSHGGNDLVFASYGDKWKLHRQLCARGLSEVAGNRLSNLEAVVAKENSDLMKRILKHGGRPFDPQMDISKLTFRYRIIKEVSTIYLSKSMKFIKSYKDTVLRFNNTDLIYLVTTLKDKSGVDKIIVKKQPYQLQNTNRDFFPSFDASNFINWFMNLRKLGQISSPFCILYECAKA